MVCTSCGLPAKRLCAACSASIRPAGQRVVSGAVVLSAYTHSGAAATLVQHLKYRRNLVAGDLLSEAMASLIGWGPSCLVPIPRSIDRRVRYGIDQTAVLADGVSACIGVPVLPCLRVPLWRQRHAGRGRDDRKSSALRVNRRVPRGAVLIDDVVTTGSTIHEALRAIGDPEIRVVTATSADTMG